MTPEDETCMLLCPTCQSLIVKFYLFKLKIHKAQENFRLPDKKPYVHQNEETEEILMLHILDIVKNFIEKYSVQSILEDENEQKLIIERHASATNLIQQEHLKSSASKVFVIKEENSDYSDFEVIEELDNATEEDEDESTMSDTEDPEATGEQVKVTKASNLSIEDKAQTESFILENIEFVDRKPEYIVNAYKPSEKPSRPKDPDNWIRNRQRNARARGEEYVTNSGKTIRAKRMLSPCKESCRFKCRKKISEEDRQKNFNKYWELASFIRQRKFIFEHHKTAPIQRRRFRSIEGGKPRQYSSQYFLDKFSSNETIEQIQVCESMFLKTFDICRNIVSHLHKKVQTGKVQDLRGINQRKLSLGHIAAIEQIKANPFYHIEQPMPITKMFQLYQQECLDKGIEPVKNHTYRKLFAEYNECEFLKRDKIICEVCDSYYKANDEEKDILYPKYIEHIENQEKCMQRAKARSTRKESKKKTKVDELIVEEHLIHENEKIEYE